MEAKYFLLALVVTSSYGAAVSHLVTSAYANLPLLACVRSLTNAVRDVLCANDPYSSDFYDPSMNAEEVSSLELKHKMIRNCCVRPCSVAQLMSIC